MKRFALRCWRKVVEPVLACIGGIAALVVPALIVGFAVNSLAAWGGASPRSARLAVWGLVVVTLFVTGEFMKRLLKRRASRSRG